MVPAVTVRGKARLIPTLGASAPSELADVNAAARCELLYGRRIRVTGTGPGTVQVAHGLARVPESWMIGRIAGDVYVVPRESAADDKILTLEIIQIGDFEFDIWVY